MISHFKISFNARKNSRKFPEVIIKYNLCIKKSFDTFSMLLPHFLEIFIFPSKFQITVNNEFSYFKFQKLFRTSENYENLQENIYNPKLHLKKNRLVLRTFIQFTVFRMKFRITENYFSWLNKSDK